MNKPENGGKKITKNSRTVFNTLTSQKKTEMGRACMKEPGLLIRTVIKNNPAGK
jgi:hypothetical protein